MDVRALYHMLRLEVLHPKMFTFARDGPLPLMWKNLTTQSGLLQPSELEALTGRTALVVGGTSGCGLELAKILAAYCSRLIITARNPQRGEQALEETTKSQLDGMNPQAQIEVWSLELESFQSIRDFTERVRRLPSLDIAVLNAGIWHLHFAHSIDSFETHLQVNYLAPCALSLSLLGVLSRGRLADARPGRLLNVTSEGHALESVPTGEVANEVLARFNDPKALTCYQRYRLSKLLSMIWTHELALSMNPRGVEIASFTPGATRTQICRNLGAGPMVRLILRLFCQTAEQGAHAYLRALITEEFHGRYLFRDQVYEPTDCVIAEKYRPFRRDLVQQTITLLGKQVSIPSDIHDSLDISSPSGLWNSRVTH
ncbi:hypothetical protein F4680DRAFT_411415 [Xylaria scruposa]|nr:hypothetical protein F4680DRAFT_411415 [Xylaria scruposa]